MHLSILPGELMQLDKKQAPSPIVLNTANIYQKLVVV
jgi:hypothetical protein